MTDSHRVKIEDVLSFVRKAVIADRLILTGHARLRMVERKITLFEIEEVLLGGRREKSKDKWNEKAQSWNYAVRGPTEGKKELRIIVAFEDSETLIVTVIDLAK